MANLNPTTDVSIAQQLLEKQSINKEERFLLDSLVTSSLIQHCGDIRPNEIDKVNEIEDECIHNFLNVTMSVFGRYNRENYLKLLSTNPYNLLVQELNMSYNGEEREWLYISCIPKLILSNGDPHLKVKVLGKMPQKMFSFRQMNADEWFQNFVNIALTRIVFVYKKLGVDDAVASLMSICAFQLYHSHPNRFNISHCTNNNDAIYYIMDSFLKSRNGVGAYVYSDNGELLSKSL